MISVLSRNRRGNFITGKILVFLILIVAFLLIGGFVWFWHLLDAPSEGKDMDPVIVSIVPGMSFQALCVELEDLGLIRYAKYLEWRYRIASRFGLAGAHQAGKYSLKQGMKPSQILRSITSPDNAQRIYATVTIPPGYTSSRIAQRIQDAHLAYAVDVENAIISLSADYPIVQTSMGLQGYLFPDTYKIESPIGEIPESSKLAAEAIIRIMANKFFSVLDKIAPSWRRLTKKQLHEKIVLASIVEREYRIAEEASMIAAVFNNRLKKGMPLQSCATVVYVIEETERGRLFRNDYFRFNRRIFEQYLDIDSPYNTYLHSFLPPSPIAIAGRIALEAAFSPANINSLYFVVKNPQKGTHTFTQNYSDHLRARDDYIDTFIVKE